MSLSPVSAAIDTAIARLQKFGVAITLDNIVTEARKHLTFADFSSDEAVDALLRSRVPGRLRGHVIADHHTHERVQHDEARIPDLEVQLRICEVSSDRDQTSLAAKKAELAFLRVKRNELGYEPWPGLFRDEIDRIYRMHGCSSPLRLAA